MIDHAEALTVIDVNTGSYTGRGRGSLEDTIVKTNLQAAEEVVRQLRLRDIGGIIVIDFIDMAYTRNRDHVLSVLRKALDEDRTRTLRGRDLAARTRRDDAAERDRGRPRDHDQALPDLPGRGRRALGGDDRDRRRAPAAQAGEGLEVGGVPGPGPPARGGDPDRRRRQAAAELEEETGKVFHFHGTEGIPLDTFAITAEGTTDEIEHRALPFKKGEEVLIGSRSPTCTTSTTRSRRSTAT